MKKRKTTQMFYFERVNNLKTVGNFELFYLIKSAET